jgi:YHS domain-containing protein
VWAVGCQQKAGGDVAQASASVKAPDEAKIGDIAVCAVHREHQIVVTDKTPHVDYKGKTYYFCCETCAHNFAEHPELFVH